MKFPCVKGCGQRTDIDLYLCENCWKTTPGQLKYELIWAYVKYAADRCPNKLGRYHIAVDRVITA